MIDIVRRHDALEATVARYRDLLLDFRLADCVRMARFHLVAMGRRDLPELPRYSGMAGAQRALKKASFVSLEEMLDSVLPRVPKARMLLGDLAVVRGGAPDNEDTPAEIDSVVIWGGQKFIGWWDGRLVRNLIVGEIKAAYRA